MAEQQVRRCLRCGKEFKSELPKSVNRICNECSGKSQRGYRHVERNRGHRRGRAVH